MSAPVFLIYYWLPVKLWSWGPEKSTALIGLLIVFWSYELFRMLRPQDQLKIAGLRDYEYHRVSAATWALTGIFMCFLAFPIEYTAPALCGMAWVDPLIGELRRGGSTLYPTLPLAIYFQLSMPYPEVQRRAYAAALILTAIVLAASLGSRWMAGRMSKNVIQ